MNEEAFARVDSVPREPLALLPTPLTAAPTLGAAIRLPELWLKRDELIGFGFGGNKVRGLEFLLADAMSNGAETLVTGAGPQSNHVRATAAAAAHCGLGSISVFWGEEPTVTEGNYYLTRLLGSDVRFTNDPDRESVESGIRAVTHALRCSGRRAYSIPRGGACTLGVLGHVVAARELYTQCEAIGLRPRRVVLAVGSGATLAGWLLGTALLGAPWRVEGVTVSRPAAEVRARVQTLAALASERLGVGVGLSEEEVVVHDGFIGDGYGLPTLEGSSAITIAARAEGVFFDPTYTAKAFAALTVLVSSGLVDDAHPVVFVHTGGQPALFAGGRVRTHE